MHVLVIIEPKPDVGHGRKLVEFILRHRILIKVIEHGVIKLKDFLVLLLPLVPKEMLLVVAVVLVEPPPEPHIRIVPLLQADNVVGALIKKIRAIVVEVLLVLYRQRFQIHVTAPLRDLLAAGTSEAPCLLGVGERVVAAGEHPQDHVGVVHFVDELGTCPLQIDVGTRLIIANQRPVLKLVVLKEV